MAILGLKTFDSFLNTMLRNYFEFMTEILRTFIAQKVLKIGAVARLELDFRTTVLISGGQRKL